jgi:uncharacterized protein YmfQ (DUF2313 family)
MTRLVLYRRQSERDRHIRRSGEDYFQAFLSLLPWGQAWPREPGGTLWRVCRGLALYWGFIDSRAADLLERESDPRKTLELLPDWERAWGLPDPCFPDATTIGERQKMLVTKITWMGGQSRAYFEKIMNWLGFAITIREFSPFMAGVSQAGDTRFPPDENFRWYIGPPEMRFVWTANAGKMGLVWFRAGAGQAGVDHHLELRPPQDLQCLLNRWKPAHTALALDFSELAFGSPMEGTP